MAGSLNKVLLIGNLGQDPDVRTFPNGGKVVNLRIATTETWTDRNSGERKERTEWHSVAIFNEGLQSIAEQYLRKGSQVYIEGKLETRKWQDQNGADRYSTEVVVRQFGGDLTMLGGAPSGEGQGRSQSGHQGGQRGQDGQKSRSQGYNDYDDGGQYPPANNRGGSGYSGGNRSGNRNSGQAAY